MATKNMKEVADSAEKQKKESFAKQVQAALQLLDLTNIPTKSYTVYNKESLRTYLKNPLSDTNSKNLRKLSQYLYVLSPQYRRIISYFASFDKTSSASLTVDEPKFSGRYICL